MTEWKESVKSRSVVRCLHLEPANVQKDQVRSENHAGDQRSKARSRMVNQKLAVSSGLLRQNERICHAGSQNELVHSNLFNATFSSG